MIGKISRWETYKEQNEFFPKKLTLRFSSALTFDYGHVACHVKIFNYHGIGIKCQVQTERSLTKSVPLFQEPDLRYLVENIWNSQSVLSAHEDLFDLILVRWNKYEEWSPWNCILLTKEEASAHAKLENVTEVRLLFFVCLCCFKAIVNRWVWGRCLSKLRKP